MSLKIITRRIFAAFRLPFRLDFQYRDARPARIRLFATFDPHTPTWLIVLPVFIYGFFTSLQYTSLNTLVYADVTEEQTSGASTITSTVQQMSISFGIATSSLLTGFFIPDRLHSNSTQMIHGIHAAFIILGAFTVLSSSIFQELKKDDVNALSLNKALQHAG